MTKNCSNLKTKIILVLTVLTLVFSCLFGFTACKEETSVTDPTYSYTEDTVESDEEIKNGTFSLNMSSKKDSDFPVTSASNWTKSVDNSAYSSSVDSGIVKLTADSWKQTVKTLYSDSDFQNYIENLKDKDGNTIGKSKSDIDTAIKESKGDDYSVTDEDRAEYIANNLYTMPDKSYEGADDYVYMLNNIRTKEDDHLDIGTAQKLSASSYSLEKGKNYKVSVYVKTQNVYANATKTNGANIRLTNTFGGSTQGEYQISNIIADDWTKYEIYVTADDTYDCTITVVLGLGYGQGASDRTLYYTKGTAFFDDVKIEEVESVPSSITATEITYGKTDKVEANEAVDIDGVKTYAYDMWENLADYYTDAELAQITEDFTKSNITSGSDAVTSKTNNTESSWSREVASNGIFTYTLNSASITISLPEMTLAPNSYYYFSTKIRANIDAFGSSDINVAVSDKPTGKGTTKTTYTAISNIDDEDWTLISVLVKNNFETGDRKFQISIVLGPTDVASIKYNSAFMSGKVEIWELQKATGSTEEDSYIVTGTYDDGSDNPEYKKYNSLFASTANATVALYAGSSSDYSEDDSTESYSLTYENAYIGEIESKPTAVSGYTGVSSENSMVKHNGTDNEANGRTGSGKNGSYAGLINTKYLSAYALTDIATNLGDYGDDDENIQPIMIYNKDTDSYGFISDTKTVSASAYASVSVKVKAVDNAKAYIYLTNVSDETKGVMAFDDFTDINGNAFVGSDHKMMFEVSKTDDNDGWTTVTFYIASGNVDKEFRIEVWNGSRDGENKSQGYVFVKDITFTSSSAFSEPSSVANAFSISGNPLYDIKDIDSEYVDQPVQYLRPLTKTEEKFNKEYPDDAVSYSASYVWAKTPTVIYAVYNTLEVEETNPYDSIEDEEEETGCKAKTDPSTFWLSLSSILLGVVLALAIIALIVKALRRKHIANKNDAKSLYKVKSRIDSHRENQKRAKKTETNDSNDESDANATEAEKVDNADSEATDINNTESSETAEEAKTDESLDSYVYGDVQDFGDAETNEDKPEEDK